MEHKNKFVKSLCIAAFLSILCIPQINSKAMAQAPVPTLDKLNQEDATIPDTDPEQVYPESAYTLTEIKDADPENLPQNAITLYDKTEVIKYYDPQTGQEIAADDRQEGVEYKEVTTIQTTPKYYTVSLKQTEYGSGDKSMTFGWEKTADGHYELKQNPTNPVGQTIIYKYTETGFSETETHSNKLGTIKNPSGTSSNPTIIEGGAALNNPTGTPDSIDNVLFKDYSTTGKVISTTSGQKYANVLGGAVYNEGTLSSVTGAFINNSLDITSERNSGYLYVYAQGGAIANSGTIENITADFVVNYVSSSGTGSYAYAFGGAIYNGNNATIGDITGDFIGNYASGSYYASGGAIFNNQGTIGDITGDFIGNYVSGSYAHGGAIFNDGGTIGNITGDFIGNYASGNSYAVGGAIYNYEGTIGDITGDFIGNYANRGGTIYNYSEIGDITGDFIGNYASSTSDEAYGGAIYNIIGTIGDITGDFIGNYASSTNSYAFGGAIYNSGSNAEIGNITGDFIGNYASSTDSYAYGGAIYNYSEIGDITGDFIGNYASSTDFSAYGGAIYNSGTIGNITGDFIGNYAYAANNAANGGAINNNNNSQIRSITGLFVNNYTKGHSSAGGAIVNWHTIGNITADFIGNYASGSSAAGGAIANGGTIGDITGDFIGNYAISTNNNAQGGAIYNNEDGTIGDITGDFIGNYASSTNNTALGGAIYNGSSNGDIGNITGDFIGNYASSTDYSAYGGAIYNYGYKGEATIGKLDDEGNLVGGIYGSFINNYAKTESDSQLALGGAVYTDSDMNFIADNQTNYFSGNYTEDYRGKINNAIFVETEEDSSPTIKLQAQNNGVIIFDDQIDGGVSKKNSQTGKYEIDRTNAYNLAIDGDSTGKVVLNNDIINANISLDNTNLYLGREDVFNQSQSLTLNSGSIYLNNQSVGTMHVPTLNLNGNTNISVDADLANKSMDRITADTYNVKDNAMLNVNNVVLLSDAKEDVTNIQFADDELASNVAFTGASPIAYSPIWKYDVSYNPDDGFFSFVRGAASSGNVSDAFNPSVLASPVATQAGAYTTQLQTFNYAFQHADTFMNIPYLERVAIINQGKYALSPTGDATDVGTYSPLLLKEESAGFWVKPYASFENVPLKNGPKVSNINYGTLVGYDSPLQSISNGFERVLTGYIGYNGASQRYSGVDAYQNGGLLGGTATFYKGNFFNATTLSVGASAGDASTMYGSENYTMLLAGLGNKTGYNFEFFDGGMILQPSMLISYTFVNTFDYTNGAGVRIESDPMHAIQLAPGIKLIGNTKNGWQPYIGVSMVWNLLDESKVTADSVRLPEMSIKPYVQYGVGLQKRVNDKFLAFGQAMIHNGGRNGVSLSAGLRWKIGRE